MISALDDILEDFSLYLRVEKRISERSAKNHCYVVGKFLRWVDTLNPEKRDAVKYYDLLLKELRADKEAVFLSRKRKRISRNRVYAVVKQYGRLAGIKKKVTPHVLRHTLATNMIARGASVIEVKE